MDLGLSLSFNSHSISPVELAEITALLSATSAMYDPSDLSTLWTDDARTTNVTSDGDAVAVMDDISGNGNHMRQTTAGSRPLYKTDGTLHWLNFDGTDDWLVTNPLFSLGGTTWTHVGGWKSNTSGRWAFATSSDFKAGLRDAANWVWYNSAGTTQTLISGDIRINHVVSVVQASLASIQGRYNGTAGSAYAPWDATATTLGLAIGSRANNASTSAFSGDFFGGVWDAQTFATADLELIERFYTQQTGL